MKKAIITGGAGFIGSNLVDLLLENKITVIIIDNLSTGKKENVKPRAKFYHEDLANFEKIKNIFEKENPDFVFHLAAKINVRESIEKPIEYAQHNILDTLNISISLSDKRIGKPGVLRWVIFTDDNLK